MIRDHSHGEKRSAFTLVELMVVILIIAILVSLISSAVVKTMNKIPEVQTSTEIRELGVALEAFKQDYGLADPPPSILLLNEQFPTSTASGPFLQRVFGKSLGPTDWNGDGTITPTPMGTPTFTLQGEQCLIFYVGGIPNTLQMATIPGTPPGPQGFSTNNMSPGGPALPNTRRKGPYFNFVTSRLKPIAANGGFFVYIDPWQTKVGPLFSTLGGSPYAFFSSSGSNNAYAVTSAFGAAPYAVRSAVPPYPPTGQFTYPNMYQIISAGKDGFFGNTGWVPTTGFPPIPFSNANANAQPAGADDQANFSSTLLGVGQN